MGGIKQKIEANFNWVIAFLCLGLFIFNFWLFFPGYQIHGWTDIVSIFPLDNWQPVIYPFLLKKMTDTFGYHLHYSLLFNLTPFYLGIYVLINGLWKKFKSKWCLLGLLPVAIGNIFFQNIMAHCSFSSPMVLFLLWTILLHQLLNGITRKNAVLAGVIFFFAVLSRHNALIQAYPVCFVYGWLIVQKLKPNRRFLKYIGILFLFAIMTVAISIGAPQIIKTRNSFPTNHIFLHQIAGACVPNHDESCFKKEWYKKEKTFTDVEETYAEFPLAADRMGHLWEKKGPFKYGKLNNLSTMWVNSIIKYPLDYLKHINNFREKMWHSRPLTFDIPLNRREHCTPKTTCKKLQKTYPKEEVFYKSSKLKINIYNFLKKVFPLIPTFLYVSLNFVLFAISGFLFLKKKDLLLLFSLSSAIAGIAGSVIFCIFAPVTIPRYIYPVLISTLISVIGLTVYLFEKGIIQSYILSIIKFIRRKKNEQNQLKIKLDFSWVIALLCLGLFIFNFWLFFPGYISYDWTLMLAYFSLNNWQPVMYPFLLKKITDIFGYHLYYPLLFNLIPFYLGIYVLVNGLWKKFKSKWCLLGFLPIAIGNIFFQNIVAHCSFSSPMVLFLLWTILLHQLLNGITRKNAALAGVVFFFAVLSRHNALIQAYPVCFVYGWLIVQKLKPAHRLLKYIGILFLFAVITVAIPIGVPQIIKTRNSFPANHIFLHQIAAACVPNHDESCFKKEWYDEGKTFADVEKTYAEFPLNADHMNRKWHPEHPFKYVFVKPDGLSTMWLKSIIKYPLDYLKHINNFREKMWHSRPLEYDIPLNRKEHCIHKKDLKILPKRYPKEEVFYKSSKLKINIYNFLKKVFPLIPTFLHVSLSFVLFSISGFFFLKKKDLLLLFSLSSAVAGIAGSIIFCVFTPVAAPRYIYPVLISTLISVIGLTAYLCEKGIIQSYILSIIKFIRRKKNE